ncbi:flavodoxin family protein (plasmid) [Roseibium aggregatum]|uniref:NAD(P)H-dependent oxidoreductase n=1 Tax=Roseibium aggregatum TaxID=187304 RepID=UPI001E3C585F|nr:NAD(P)H-dependent oxidoreductase [Roseibium aggregatum]MEC9469593.1 NAD(P)H-dependent oxidoreductase [Pseudomonadota bacterium]UES59956.1 flavodoxin family protein [Roseibium aggregatum]
MQVHIVHAHPEPSSYNGALTETARRALSDDGSTVTMTDLYRSDFDPVERETHYQHRSDADRFAALAEQRHAWNNGSLPGEIQSEIDNLKQANLVILQFPLWWHGPPAILKGWMDRVFVSGGIYTSRARYDTGYFRGKRALVSVTTGAPHQAFGPGSRGGDFDTMLWPIHYSLHYVGFSVLPPFISYGVQGHGYSYEDEDSLHTRLKLNLFEWRSRLSSLETSAPLRFPGWDDWDEGGKAVRR